MILSQVFTLLGLGWALAAVAFNSRQAAWAAVGCWVMAIVVILVALAWNI